MKQNNSVKLLLKLDRKLIFRYSYICINNSSSYKYLLYTSLNTFLFISCYSRHYHHIHILTFIWSKIRKIQNRKIYYLGISINLQIYQYKYTWIEGRKLFSSLYYTCRYKCIIDELCCSVCNQFKHYSD